MVAGEGFEPSRLTHCVMSAARYQTSDIPQYLVVQRGGGRFRSLQFPKLADYQLSHSLLPRILDDTIIPSKLKTSSPLQKYLVEASGIEPLS